MTKEEYKAELSLLEQEFNDKKDMLARKYAYANKKYKEGDILECYDEIILVDKIMWGYGLQEPRCSYYGYLLKKDLTPRKDKKRSNFSQSENIIKLK